MVVGRRPAARAVINRFQQRMPTITGSSPRVIPIARPHLPLGAQPHHGAPQALEHLQTAVAGDVVVAAAVRCPASTTSGQAIALQRWSATTTTNVMYAPAS